MNAPLNVTRRDSAGFWIRASSLALLALCFGAGAQESPSVSEKDYLGDVPIVLSVSRLPQRLDETPGALTILDRDFIRSSGARDVVDVLRLVPGFQVSNAFEADAPQASYHGVFNVFSARVQVLIDGRSVYSTYLFGSVAPGLMSVALDDIERIEVFRGSNSTTYGARAMLGVINIVTRSALDSPGARAMLTRGDNGIQDTLLSVAWPMRDAFLRLSVDQRGDDGLKGANGRNRVQRLNFRADVPVESDAQLELRTGWLGIDAGRGFVSNPDAPLRDTAYASNYFQLDWRQAQGVDQDYALSFSRTRESYTDVAAYALAPVNLDYSGRASNDTLKFESVHRITPDLRYVWGAELRRESVTSQPLYNRVEAIHTDFKRVFANVEWRPSATVLLNAGGMVEHSSAYGSSVAPRLMANWQLRPGHTLRAGVARAFRPPSVFEAHGDIRYTVSNQLLAVTTLARGQVIPESVLTRELGYLAQLDGLRSQLDVRVFDEAITGLIQSRTYALPAGTTLLPSAPRDYFNGDSLSIRGFELQWQTRPWAGARLGLSLDRSLVVHGSPLVSTDLEAVVPKSAHTVSLEQQLLSGWQIALNHRYLDSASLPSTSSYRGSLSRTDLRLAKSMQWGASQGEVALTVQNVGGDLPDYRDTFSLPKQVFVTLRLMY